MKFIKTFVKWLLIFLVVVGIVSYIAAKVMSESRPVSNPTPEADELANEMLMAMNKPAWDSLHYLKWEFLMGHQYVWDKKANVAKVSWGINRVLLKLDEVDGRAYVDGIEVTGERKDKLIKEAWKYWCNDSFWMFAPFKVFDTGTTRTKMDVEGKQGLLVSYESGGVTPGDAYLWILGENKIPTSFKMWTFLPLKGMEVSWENWKTIDGGVKLSLTHGSSLTTFDMKGVKAGETLVAIGEQEDVFEPIR